MKKIKALFFVPVLVCMGLISFKPASGLYINQPADTSKIVIRIKQTNSGILNKDNIAIELQIENISGAPIRIPDIFTDLKANAYLSVTEEAGRTVIPIEMAFTDYSAGGVPSYLTIAKGKSYKKAIDLSGLLKNKNINLTGGIYKLEACYINNKGTDCIKGTFYSNPIVFEVKKGPEPVMAAEPSRLHRVGVVSNVATFTATKDTLHVKPFAPVTKSINQTGKFTDKRDGQVYTWVKIGKQTWMSQNLNRKSQIGCSFYPDGDTTNAHQYGLYYDFAALEDVCPKGWHVPTDQEWQQLEVNGGIPADQVVKTGWNGDDISPFLPGGTTGFNVLYAGVRKNGGLVYVNERAYFWAAEQGNNPQYIYRRIFIKDHNRVMRATQGIAFYLSLRCVKDNDMGE